MKLSLSGNKSTVLFSSDDDIVHCGIELEKNESLMVCSGDKHLTIVALQNGFYIEETPRPSNEKAPPPQ